MKLKLLNIIGSLQKKNVNAQFQLGECYRLGKGIEKDEIKAFESYKKPAENGNEFAQYHLGQCYKFGIGIKKDETKAFEYLKKSAEKGHNMARIVLCYLYMNGEGTEKDLDKAIYWFNKATENKFAQYHQLLLLFLNFFILSMKFVSLFIVLIYRFVILGTILVRICLGQCYKAFEYFKKSAEKEYVDSQFQLCYCYHHGIGTNINNVKAFELYKIAAEKEYA